MYSPVWILVLFQAAVYLVNAQAPCFPIEYHSRIPECTFGCYCVGKIRFSGYSPVFTATTECRHPECDGDVTCANPAVSCGCPDCEEREDCVALDEVGNEVIILAGHQENAGCAVCQCDPPAPAEPCPGCTSANFPADLRRKATCDYSNCACQSYDEDQIYDTLGDIPECTFGCFCIRSENAALCIDPGVCEVSNKCQFPEKHVCGCPVCEDGDCFAKPLDESAEVLIADDSAEEVLIADDGPQPVGCAVCTCDAPSQPIIIPFFTPGTPIPPIPARTSTCDYSQCACHGYAEEAIYETYDDVSACVAGCFCIREENERICINPAPCDPPNLCHEPYNVCGCTVCGDPFGDCFAKSYDDEEVLISGDGPQDVGCAVCTCDPPSEPAIPLSTPATFPPRSSTCDYSQCACQGHDESEIYETAGDIPPCTFGCFCIREHDAVLCVDPAPCERSNLCQEPEFVCGCTECPGPFGDCYAKTVDDVQVLISGGGPRDVGCAVCTCDPPFTVSPHGSDLVIPERHATCDYSGCHCQGDSNAYDTGADIPECTFGCFCIRSHGFTLCKDPAPCSVDNRCKEPTSNICGCPICDDEAGECLAKSIEHEEVWISDEGPQNIGCAVCTCDPPSDPVFFPFYAPGIQIPSIPPRTATCDYSQCICQGYEDESDVYDTIADIPDCVFGCFCIREDNQELCIDPAPCEVSNICQDPDDVCGCPVCPPGGGNCYAVSFEHEDVLISDNGPQQVGCAVCICDAASPPIVYPFYIPGVQEPVLPKRGYSCDYSNCYHKYYQG